MTAGAAFGYQRTRVDVRNSGDRTDIDSYSAALYGAYRVGAWFVDAQAMSGARIEPFAGLRFDRVTRDGFSESGAGALGLSVDDTALSTLRTSLGLRTSWRLKAGETALEPELRTRWDHDFLNVAARSGARLLGASYTVAGVQPGRDAAVLGAGLTAALGERFHAYGSYDADLQRDATAHTLSAGLRYRW
ncbi:hypothetical protein [Azospirillum argentinense]